MSDYITEQEQIEQLKTWLKQYGLTIVTGVVLAFIIMGGWNYWKNYQNKILAQASNIYDEMLGARSQNNANANNVAIRDARLLRNDYPRTPYAKIAGLLLARNALLQKDYPEAESELKWVANKSADAELGEIANLRLARVFLAEDKANEALTLLNNSSKKSFSGFVAELKGDAYVKLKQFDQAKQSYQTALKEYPAEIVTARPILQMKYDNLMTATS